MEAEIYKSLSLTRESNIATLNSSPSFTTILSHSLPKQILPRPTIMQFLAILSVVAFTMALPTTQLNEANQVAKRQYGYGPGKINYIGTRLDEKAKRT